MQSLRGLIALRPSVLFCGHRGAVPDATQHLVMKLQASADACTSRARCAQSQNTQTHVLLHP
jgi:hypothetical protein